MFTLYLFCLLVGQSTGEDPANADTLVICPPDFQDALLPWLEYRRGQGYRILVQPPVSTAFELRQRIRSVAKRHPLKNIVLIGDSANPFGDPNRLVPTDYVVARVNVQFGSEPEIATDNTYADIDDDGIVDLAIGRIPIDTPDELTRFINRLEEYEHSETCGPWQRQINFVAGVGGFGKLLDGMIELSVKRIVTDLVPPQYNTTMTYGNWRSPWCPSPRMFTGTAIERFNEGCMFWVYIGHGDRQRLDRVQLPDGHCEILDNHSVDRIASRDGAPIAIFLSCYTAATDAPVDGLAEVLLKQQRGPIAAISSTRVAMPYAMSIFSLAMMDGYFEGQARTLGELILDSKRAMVIAARPESEYHQLIEAMGEAFSPDPALLDDERLEHLQLLHLLGDPLLQLKRPDRLVLQSPETARPGAMVTIRGTAEIAGQMTVDLAYRRDRFRTRPPRRRQYNAAQDSPEVWQAVYRQAQDQVCTRTSCPVGSGKFSIQMRIPDHSIGACHIRAMLVAPHHMALGSNDINIIANPQSGTGNPEP